MTGWRERTIGDLEQAEADWILTPASIKALRREIGLTQEQFADHLGIHPMTVSKWERGEYLISHRTSITLMALFENDIRNHFPQNPRLSLRVALAKSRRTKLEERQRIVDDYLLSVAWRIHGAAVGLFIGDLGLKGALAEIGRLVEEATSAARAIEAEPKAKA
jgi:DNA-binding transcriptional regulator YiaG